MRRIALDCLSCGHASSVAEEKLPLLGLASDVSLAVLTKKLVCKKCGSHSVQAFRYVEDTEGPPLVPEDG